jgi:hypothetical protein
VEVELDDAVGLAGGDADARLARLHDHLAPLDAGAGGGGCCGRPLLGRSAGDDDQGGEGGEEGDAAHAETVSL